MIALQNTEMRPEGSQTESRCPSSALLLSFGEGSPTKIVYRKKSTLILTSLQDLGISSWTTFESGSYPRLGQM